tara:strand:+ start:365 stop:541 length:177 start_codon:yes stop_codon:yes gene_type:complete
MLFRNAKGELKEINKLNYVNDNNYYLAIKNFMSADNNDNDFDKTTNKLLDKIENIISN